MAQIWTTCCYFNQTDFVDQFDFVPGGALTASENDAGDVPLPHGDSCAAIHFLQEPE